jgi:hypothetical protein
LHAKLKQLGKDPSDLSEKCEKLLFLICGLLRDLKHHEIKNINLTAEKNEIEMTLKQTVRERNLERLLLPLMHAPQFTLN